MQSPSRDKPVVLDEYMQKHDLSIHKFFTLRVQLNRSSQWAEYIFTGNRRWFLQIENYSAEEAKQFNSQFGFEEFEDETSAEETKKVPVSQQIIRGMLLGMTVEFDKLPHSNLKFHVYTPPPPAPSPSVLSETAAQCPAHDSPESELESESATHKCLFMVSMNNLDGNVAVLFQSESVTGDSEQTPDPTASKTNRFVKVNEMFVWESELSGSGRYSIEVGNLHTNSNLKLQSICFDSPDKSLLDQIIELTQTFQRPFISDNKLIFSQTDLDYFSKHFERFKAEAESPLSGDSELDGIEQPQADLQVSVWFLTGLVHKSLAADEPQAEENPRWPSSNRLNSSDKFLFLRVYELERVFGAKLNTLYEFERVRRFTSQMKPFFTGETQLLGEFYSVRSGRKLQLQHLGCFALKTMLDLSHSRVRRHFGVYSPTRKDHSIRAESSGANGRRQLGRGCLRVAGGAGGDELRVAVHAEEAESGRQADQNVHDDLRGAESGDRAGGRHIALFFPVSAQNSGESADSEEAAADAQK